MKSLWRKIHSTLMCSIAGAIVLSIAAQGAPIPVLSTTKQANGVFMKMQPGSMKLQVCNDAIIRVTYSLQDTIPVRPTDTFMVNKNWSAVSFTLDTLSDVNIINVSTAKIRAAITRTTGAVSFFDANGNLILQEATDGGKTLTPATVNGEATYHPSQRFVSPADEAVYGLGQFQDSVMNYRGIPLELLQVNTHIANPVMVSTKGYGILWPNPSKCYFNPPDTLIAMSSGSGHFMTGDAGVYVFASYDGGVSSNLTLKVNGMTLGTLVNTWIGPAIGGKITLPANTSVPVALTGSGTVYGGPFKNETKFVSEVGETVDYYFMYGPDIDNVIADYRTATGTAPLLPKWAYGFVQCRERYSSQQMILDSALRFRQKNIPVDCIVQDWNYWPSNQWGSMTFDATAYPNPTVMIDSLHKMNFHYMISAWSNPQGSSALSTALGNQGLKIPGSDYFDAFYQPARQVYWSYMNTNLLSIGVDAFWQDADEPEGDKLLNQTFKGPLGQISGNRYRLAYPLHVCMTGYQGQRSTSSAKRVCILTRSGFMGIQRYGIINWSGDINSNWDWFTRQVTAGLNYCMTGLPYWTTDIGGFFRPGGQYTSASFQELLTRWFEYGAFCPIFRIHGYGTATEIWNYGATVQANCTLYDNLRYRLLPYIYSLAWMVTNNHSTIMRALPMDFRTDATVRGIKDQFMFGPAFLVNPVLAAGATSRSVYLPAGTWYDFWTGTPNVNTAGRTVTAAAPLSTMPIYIRAGSIVPMGPELQYSSQKQPDTIELRVYTGASGSFQLYEDEGDSYNYENGTYATIPITFNSANGTLTIGARNGSFPGMLQNRIFNIVYVAGAHGTGEGKTTNPDCVVQYSGAAVTASCQGPTTGIMRPEPDKALSNAQGFCFTASQDRVVFPAIYYGKIKSVGIYEPNGKLVFRKSFRKNSISLQKDMGISKGVYIIKVNTTSDITPIQK